MKIKIGNSFTKSLPADRELSNTRRQVQEAVYSYVDPIKTSQPELLHVSEEVMEQLGISEQESISEEFLGLVTGNSIAPGSKPFAMVYGGHQFGQWAGQLGDGRAINLGDVEHNNKRFQIQLKGAGPTPYSRRGDGLAVLRSSIREYLCSEAMHHLGIPTTRALSLALSGDQVMRDMLYDGNSAYEKGAIVCRVSESFLRFGNFEIFAARNDKSTLQTLVDYTITTHFAHLGTPCKEVYIAFFDEVAQRTLSLILEWQRVGFVHGVMNTDNMSILGQTIDYGPYGWLEGFDFGWTPNTTDSQQKRYRYGHQPSIGLWNLYQLANALYPLIEEAAPLEAVLEDYKKNYEVQAPQMMRAKLGLTEQEDSDTSLIQELEGLLHEAETDMTIFFRELGNFSKAAPQQGLDRIKDAFYHPEQIPNALQGNWDQWFASYAKRLQRETRNDAERKIAMNKVNPKYVLRNYMAQMAIDRANQGDYALIDELYQLLKNPYSEQPEAHRWYAKRPEWARHKVGCSMLSCSS